MKLYLTLFLIAVSLAVAAQGSNDLFKKIESMDNIIFTAFNTCDLETFGSMFTNDLEFYHDKGGLTDYAYTINAIKGNCNHKLGLTRTLVPGSMEVYPIDR